MHTLESIRASFWYLVPWILDKKDLSIINSHYNRHYDAKTKPFDNAGKSELVETLWRRAQK